LKSRSLIYLLLVTLIALPIVGCDKADSPVAITAAAEIRAAPTAPSDYPAFHNGGPLLGVAALIAPPPMRKRWEFRADSDPAPPPKPNDASASTVTPAYESAPAIVGGVVYAADRSGALRAIDIKTGHRLWTYRSDGGFSAGPAVVDGAVYIGDEDGVFHAVDAKTGQKRWTFDAGSGIHSSANFYKGKLVFGDDGADIYCLSADGKKLWDAKAGDRVNGSPAIGAAPEGQSPSVFVSGCDSELRSIDIDTGKERYAREMGALCPGSPAVLPDRIVIGTDGGKIVCVAADGKSQLWAFEGVKNQAMVYSSPAVSDGIVVAGARDRIVYALDLATGAKKWTFSTSGDVDSSPVISDGRVYIGSKDKHLYVLDLKTGNKLWDFTASRQITGTPAIAGGVVVVGDTSGSLYCLEPDK
jgi:hypothetical protein